MAVRVQHPCKIDGDSICIRAASCTCILRGLQATWVDVQLSPDAVNQVLSVDLDVHKDVHAWYCSNIHRHKAAMPIVHQEICSKCCCTEVIYTASAVCHIAQDEAMLHTCKTASMWGCH